MGPEQDGTAIRIGVADGHSRTIVAGPSLSENDADQRPVLDRSVRRGNLVRRRSDHMSEDARRHLMAARDQVQDLVLGHGLQSGSGFVSVSIGAPPPVSGRRVRFGYLPILVESDSPDLLRWAGEAFARGFEGLAVKVLAGTTPLAQAGIGSSLSRSKDHESFGTLGCFVRRGGRLFGLTARHVVALPDNPLGLGEDVVSPANVFSTIFHPSRSLGTVAAADVDTDSAVIALKHHQLATARNEIPFRRGPKSLRSLAVNGSTETDGEVGKVIWDNGWAVSGLRVAKVGAAIGNYRVGHVQEIQKTIRFDNAATLSNLFTVASSDGRRFSEPGDSGSLVFEDSGRRPVGMVLGGNGTTSACAEFNHIVYNLDVELP